LFRRWACGVGGDCNGFVFDRRFAECGRCPRGWSRTVRDDDDSAGFALPPPPRCGCCRCSCCCDHFSASRGSASAAFADRDFFGYVPGGGEVKSLGLIHVFEVVVVVVNVVAFVSVSVVLECATPPVPAKPLPKVTVDV